MLPHRPRALDAASGVEFAVNVSRDETAACDTSPAEHHSQICPTCSHRLTGHRCKLICTECGYYLSCADYY